MFITNYGITTIVKYVIIASLVIVLFLLFSNSSTMLSIAVCIVVIFLFFLLLFFRDPERNIPKSENIIVSPADGKVIIITNLFENSYLQAEAIQISIFMSPLNVHVNRIPVSGIIGYFDYIKGKHVAAFKEKSSKDNEQTIIGIENNGYKILLKQIAGIIARRIVANVKVGQKVTRGERFGMIKFGSRVDIIIPKDAELKIKLNERVIAGETIIATYKL